MKLARVDHIRCGEWDGAFTYVWIEDDMTEEQFQKAVDRAADAYLQAVIEYMGANEQKHPPMINWENNRARVVAEVLDERQVAETVYKNWEKKRREAIVSFDTYLCKEEGIVDFWYEDPAITGEIDWGHRHGTPIDYGETRLPRFNLLKKARKVTPGRTVRIVSHKDEWA